MQMIKQVLSAMKMVPMVEAVNLPFFTRHIDDNGKFNADEGMNKAADAMLKELEKWTAPMKSMRTL